MPKDFGKRKRTAATQFDASPHSSKKQTQPKAKLSGTQQFKPRSVPLSNLMVR